MAAKVITTQQTVVLTVKVSGEGGEWEIEVEPAYWGGKIQDNKLVMCKHNIIFLWTGHQQHKHCSEAV